MEKYSITLSKGKQKLKSRKDQMTKGKYSKYTEMLNKKTEVQKVEKNCK